MEVSQGYPFHPTAVSVPKTKTGALARLDKRMFFGNSSGLLMYDGANWRTFPYRGER